MRRLVLLAWALSAPACGIELPDVPSDLGAATIFLYAHFDGADETVAGAVESIEAATGHLDPVADLSRRSFMPPILTAENLAEGQQTPNSEPQEQLRVAILGRSAHALAVHRRLALIADRKPFHSEDLSEYTRTILTEGPACFSDDTCRRVELEDKIHQSNFVLDIPYTSRGAARVVPISNDRLAMVLKTWLPKKGQPEGGGASLDQNYELWVFWPEAGATQRTRVFIANWASYTGVFLLSQGLFNEQVSASLQETVEKYDKHVDDGG